MFGRCDLLTTRFVSDYYLLVERGSCSFAEKVYAAQQLGAKGIVVYNSVAALYDENDQLPKVCKVINIAVACIDCDDCYDGGQKEYDCHHGSASNYADLELMHKCEGANSCSSHRCARISASPSTKACCVWDLYMTMGIGEDSSVSAAQIHIPAMFITMADMDQIISAAGANGDVNAAGIEIRVAPILQPQFSFLPSLLLWLLGVATCIGAAAYSNRDLLLEMKGYFRLGRRDSDLARHSSSGEGDDIESVELTSAHAVGFIAMASCGLLIMFFVNLYEVLCVLYALAAATSLQVILTDPLCAYLLSVAKLQHSEYYIPGWGILRLPSLCGFVLAWTIAWVWYFTRFDPYAWILQNLIGVMVCTLFLSTIHFSNTKVATILLSLAFVYDVFFVFLSPLLFNESVMVKVASGEGPTKDTEYCEKYPDDSGCQTKSLPMLFLMPRFDGGDGFALLGLGDVVLPGLLLCFVMRFDLCTFGRMTWRQGYFYWVALGYALGLLLADVAVAATGMGQPALLYIVPCTLGVQILLASRRGELREMWDGPKSLLRKKNMNSNQWEAEYGDGFDDDVDVSL